MNKYAFFKTSFLAEKVKQVKEAISLLITLFPLFQPLGKVKNFDLLTYFYVFTAPLCLTHKIVRKAQRG
jgi:hypothetical protein